MTANAHECPAMQLWGKFSKTNTQTDQARPKKQQGRNLTGQTRPSKAASNGPIAGSLASQQSAKSSARLASRRSVDSARGAQNCTCARAVRGRSRRSCSQNRTLGVSLTEPAGFARLLRLFQTEKTARNKTKACDPSNYERDATAATEALSFHAAAAAAATFHQHSTPEWRVGVL